jgi:hypothetical protein
MSGILFIVADLLVFSNSLSDGRMLSSRRSIRLSSDAEISGETYVTFWLNFSNFSDSTLILSSV